MKKKGATCDYNAARDEAILQAYRRHALACERIRVCEIAEKVAATPGCRFYVSEERALAVVSAMIRGTGDMTRMKDSKRRMFVEIYRRVEALRRQRPRSSLISLVSEVVNSPAPELYLSPRYVYDRITSMINSRRKWKI